MMNAPEHTEASDLKDVLEEIEAAKSKREKEMPDEKAAIEQLYQAYQRLKELGWNDARSAPKNGSAFSIIELGCTGIHRAHRDGISFWVRDDGDLWPSDPILFKRDPEDEAAYRTAIKQAVGAVIADERQRECP